jgi:hypothetical protein
MLKVDNKLKTPVTRPVFLSFVSVLVEASRLLTSTVQCRGSTVRLPRFSCPPINSGAVAVSRAKSVNQRKRSAAPTLISLAQVTVTAGMPNFYTVAQLRRVRRDARCPFHAPAVPYYNLPNHD